MPLQEQQGLQQNQVDYEAESWNIEHAASSGKFNCTYPKGNILCKLYHSEMC